MKKNVAVTILLSFLFSGSLFAQKPKVYVSRHGGKKNAISGDFSYNTGKYKFYPGCDTLIYFDPGYEPCRIPEGAFTFSRETMAAYPLFNKAIKVLPKLISQTKKKSGELNIVIDETILVVKYFDAEETGEATFTIELL
jgi:hypothetical protein